MRAAWLEVNLGAYRRNLRALEQHSGCPVLAVVKANGYGHGIVSIAAAAITAGCPGVAVALPEEGAELREAGQAGRIVVLGLMLEEQADLIARYDLEPVITRREVLQALARSANAYGKRLPVHVKVDTGMSRVGVEPEEAIAFCTEVSEEPRVALAGVLTHFASSEVADTTSSAAQWARFEPIYHELRQWDHPPVFHASNSGAALWFPPARLDWVRGGLVTYGVRPAPRDLPVSVEPVAALKARIVQIKGVPAGRAVSYGGTWTADRPSRLGIAPLGYGDGLPWSLSNRGCALVNGRRAPIRGRVCMDQVVLDLTDVGTVQPGDEAVFIGSQGEQHITAEELAETAGTIPYEILTRFAARLPRVVVETC